MAAVEVARTGIEGPLRRIKRDRMDVAANDRVGSIAQKRRRTGAAFLEIGILTEGIGDLDRLPAVSGVKDVHRSGSANYVAVVSPHEQFRPVDAPSMNAV